MRGKIILLGDSITEESFDQTHLGWGAGFASLYSRSADVLNRGFSGYNTRWIKAMIPNILSEFQNNPSQVIITTLLLGSNDCASASSFQHVPLAEYRDNLTSIVIQLLQFNPNMEVLLITPPPIDHNSINPNWDIRSAVKDYAITAAAVATERRIISVDLWKGPHAMDDSDLRDGLHPNAAGNTAILANILAAIKESLPQYLPEVLYNYPPWSDLANVDPNQRINLVSNSKWA